MIAEYINAHYSIAAPIMAFLALFSTVVIFVTLRPTSHKEKQHQEK